MGMPVAKMTLAEFIEWENTQPGRNEFHRGEVFAMVGGHRNHGCVVANLTGEIRQTLKGTPCRVFSEGMKVQVADDTILYPDVFVTCDRADPDTRVVQAFRRNAQGEWAHHDMTEGPTLDLPCIDASVSLAEVFDGVDPVV